MRKQEKQKQYAWLLLNHFDLRQGTFLFQLCKSFQIVTWYSDNIKVFDIFYNQHYIRPLIFPAKFFYETSQGKGGTALDIFIVTLNTHDRWSPFRFP